MFPELRIVVGHAQVVLSLHAVAIAAGVAAGATLATCRARERHVVLLAVSAVAIGGLAGARAWNATLHGVSGGLASTGGIAAGLAAVVVVAALARRPVLELLDAIAPAFLLALAIGRVGCFLAGCCYGAPTALPWGVVFSEPGPPARHPLQMYAAAGDVALLLLLPPRTAPPGTAFRRLAAGFGLLRFALECLRDPGTTVHLRGGWLTVPQVACVLLVAGTLALRLRGPSTMPPTPEERAEWPTKNPST